MDLARSGHSRTAAHARELAHEIDLRALFRCMGLYELLSVTEAFKDQVTKEPNLTGLRRQAVIDGMRPLRLAGALRVAEGVTTIEEVLSATPPLE